MGILNHLTYDGVDSSDFGVFISGESVFDAPARRGEMISIPGRDGSLFMDEGVFENIPVEYPAFIGTGYQQIFRAALGSLRSELTSRGGYKRLTDTYNPDEFRLGVYRSGLEVEPKVINRAGNFTIVFDCKPQRFLVSGEVPIVLNSNSVITNPTLFKAKPLLKVRGNGLIRIGDYAFTVSNNSDELFIDSDLMEVYKLVPVLRDLTDEDLEVITDENNADIQVSTELAPEGMSEKVVFENYVYPLIVPGDVPVRLSSFIEELTIIPRWWRL